MSKYRIIEKENKFYIQKKGWFFWVTLNADGEYPYFYSGTYKDFAHSYLYYHDARTSLHEFITKEIVEKRNKKHPKPKSKTIVKTIVTVDGHGVSWSNQK